MAAPPSSSELLRDLVAEVAAQRSDLAELHAAVQLVLAMLDEVLVLLKHRGGDMPVRDDVTQ